MRTTLDIDDDLLQASKELAQHEGTTAGVIVSRLLRQALTAGAPASGAAPAASLPGFQPFPGKPGAVVTDELVNRLRDQAGI